MKEEDTKKKKEKNERGCASQKINREKERKNELKVTIHPIALMKEVGEEKREKKYM